MTLKQYILVLNDAVTRCFGVNDEMRFFCSNDINMRHLKNRSLEKCLIWYQFINL